MWCDFVGEQVLDAAPTHVYQEFWSRIWTKVDPPRLGDAAWGFYFFESSRADGVPGTSFPIDITSRRRMMGVDA